MLNRPVFETVVMWACLVYCAVTYGTESDVPVPEMVSIAGACFVMGSPKGEPERGVDEWEHEVCLPAFRISRFEITFEQYDAFARATGREMPGDWNWGRGQLPVIWVSWNDANAYVAWLKERTGKAFALPTEAQWEFAARGGTDTPFWNGVCPDRVGVNFADTRRYGACAEATGRQDKRTWPVGSGRANAFGLHDMLGNVWEWTCSRYEEAYQGAESRCDSGNEDTHRVLRGGSWNLAAFYSRAAGRNWNLPELRIFSVGFRVVEN